jgi:hypothetical protein
LDDVPIFIGKRKYKRIKFCLVSNTVQGEKELAEQEWHHSNLHFHVAAIETFMPSDNLQTHWLYTSYILLQRHWSLSAE